MTPRPDDQRPDPAPDWDVAEQRREAGVAPEPDRPSSDPEAPDVDVQEQALEADPAGRRIRRTTDPEAPEADSLDQEHELPVYERE